MKLSARQKKWRKRILIFLALRVIFGAIFFYVVDYRFKEIIQVAVKEKSHGTYKFDAKGIDVSIFKKNIIIKNAIFYRKDTVNTLSHYNVKIPELYFSIASFTDLIFHQKVSVDSLSIMSPIIDFHQHKRLNNKQVAANPHGVEIFLHKILNHLQVKALHINNATYIFRSRLNPSVLKISRINFTVKNFSNAENENKHFLAAEDIDVAIGKQQISFPDGIHSVDFKDLHFSGKNQYVEIDSFGFHAKAIPNRAATQIIAEKIRFKSSELSEIFSKDDLIIDTMMLQNPVFEFGRNKYKSLKPVDNSKLKHLFKEVKLKFINVENGSFLNPDSLVGDHYATKKINLKIYNFSYFPAKPKLLKVDSIKLMLNKIKFISNNGKSQLTVDELGILKNEVIFKNAVYASVHPSKYNNLSFTTPELRLKNVSINDLLNKKITAEQADLLNPVIKISSKVKVVAANDTIADFTLVFNMLHNIKSLITVKKFNIKDGSLSLKSQGKVLTQVAVQKLNISILGDKFLSSDTTLELKHAIPKLRFKVMDLKSAKIHLKLSDYRFVGTYRHNWAKSLVINLPNGTKIGARDLYWEWLDWDLYRSYKMIFVDSLKIHQFNVSLNTINAQKNQQKPLPKLHIGRVDIANFNFQQQHKNGVLRFAGENIFGQNIESKNNTLVWNNIGGVLNDINYSSNNLSVNATKAKINLKENNTIQGIDVKLSKPNKKFSVSSPLIQLKGPFTSTNFKEFNIESFVLNQPNIKFSAYDSSKVVGKIPFSIPLNVNINHFRVEQAKLHLQNITGKDTVEIVSDLSLKVNNLNAKKEGDKLISIKSTELDINKLNFSKSDMVFSAPLLFKSNNTLVEKHNYGIEISSEIELNTTNLNFNYVKDSTAIKLSKASFNITDKSFNYENKSPFNWDRILYKTSIKDADFCYSGKKSTIGFDHLQWNPQLKKLKMFHFNFKPNLSVEETKLKNPWQADYIKGSAEMVLMQGLNISKFKTEKSIYISDVFVDSAKLSVSRDKQMPVKNNDEKLMPTKLLAGIKPVFKLNRLHVNNGSVNVHEISAITGREGVISLGNLNAELVNVGNHYSTNDSLILNGSAKLMGQSNVILKYRESYLDPLSGFKTHLQIAPIDMTTLSNISAPLAAIKINNGKADTITANWRGNKYFADGQMLLPYQNLHVALLDKQNPERSNLALFFENRLVNMLLRNNNRNPSFMFFERKKSKFVFNYWIKTLLSGFATSTGLKSNNKLKRADNKARKFYNMPIVN